MHMLQQRLNRAIAHHERSEFEQAERGYADLLATYPGHAGVWHLFGLLAHQTQRLDQAVERLTQAVELDPTQPGYHYNLGLALLDSGRPRQACDSLRATLAKKPGHLTARFALGRGSIELGEREQASKHLLKCVARQHEWPEAWKRLGTVLHEMGHLEEAVDAYRVAIEQAPNDADLPANLATALGALGKFEEAERLFERALALDPAMNAARVNKATLLLQQGRLREGWPLYEARWQMSGRANPSANDSVPRWRGESLAGKWLWVHGEQGLGDQIMFSTCLPDVARQAARTTVSVDPRLQPLLARSLDPECTARLSVKAAYPEQTMFNWSRERPDFQIALGDLPGILRTEMSDFPRHTPRLAANPADRRHWQRWLATLGAGLKIGVSWRGGTEPQDMAQRSCGLNSWAPLLKSPGVRWINLQHGPARSEAARIVMGGRPLLHEPPHLDPTEQFDSLSALISELDLLITVSNTNAHLAGALGIEAWVLLPKYTGWRWFQGHSRSPWYDSVQQFRQPTMGKWNPLIETIRRQLAERVGGMRRIA